MTTTFHCIHVLLLQCEKPVIFDDIEINISPLLDKGWLYIIMMIYYYRYSDNNVSYSTM